MRSLVLLSIAGLALAIPKLRPRNTLPSFVKDYAPLLHMHSQDPYFPSDISAQISHTVPEVNNTAVSNQVYTLDNLDQLNAIGGKNIYLTSKEGIQALPQWFQGVKPDVNGIVSGAKTAAVVVVDKPDIDGGVIDVFYFYFYAYNQGNNVIVFGQDLGQYGDHVGDWEHNMIRFKAGKPQAIWYSQHAYGEAFTYDAVEKVGLRPVVYVGNGTHANWAKTGPHDHTLQLINLPQKGVLTDYTDAGPTYDPAASAYYYSFDNTTKQFTAYDADSVNWLNFDGQWGDQQLPDNTPGQKMLFGNAKYSGGPNGPKFKDLDRPKLCLKKMNPCVVSPILTS